MKNLNRAWLVKKYCQFYLFMAVLLSWKKMTQIETLSNFMQTPFLPMKTSKLLFLPTCIITILSNNVQCLNIKTAVFLLMTCTKCKYECKKYQFHICLWLCCATLKWHPSSSIFGNKKGPLLYGRVHLQHSFIFIYRMGWWFLQSRFFCRNNRMARISVAPEHARARKMPVWSIFLMLEYAQCLNFHFLTCSSPLDARFFNALNKQAFDCRQILAKIVYFQSNTRAKARSCRIL